MNHGYRRTQAWKTRIIPLALMGILGLLASQAGSAVLIDWVQWESGKNLGVVADPKGTKIEIAQTTGPTTGEKALKATASLVEWGAVWTNTRADLSRMKALKFKARVSAPALLEVALIDAKKIRYVAKVRVVSDEWEEFILPLSVFENTKYPSPEAPKGVALDFSHM